MYRRDSLQLHGENIQLHGAVTSKLLNWWLQGRRGIRFEEMQEMHGYQ